MARQPFETRLILGRSAYQPPTNSSASARQNLAADPDEARPRQVPTNRGVYIQQYDSEGHPRNARSKEIARQSRRAQNDVLSTVRVCVRVDSNEQPVRAAPHLLRPTISRIRGENHYGLILGFVDWTFSYLLALSLVGLRQRLQTFSFYTEVSLPDIVRVEWKHLGPHNLFLPGLLATSLFRWLRAHRLDNLHNTLTRHFVLPINFPKRRRRMMVITHVLKSVLEIAAFVVVAPLEIFATIQRLNLCPDSALLPPPWAMIPFSSLSPFQRWSPDTQRTFGGFSTALVTSPFVLLWLLETAKSWTDNRLYVYIRWLVPKPTNPTPNSELAAKEDDLTYDLFLSKSQNDNSQRVSDYFRRAYLRILDMPAILTGWARLHTYMSINEEENVYGIAQSTNESNTQLLRRDENIHLTNNLDITSEPHESLNPQSMRSPGEFDRISQFTNNVRPRMLEEETAPGWHQRNVAQARWRPTKTVDSGKHHRMSISAWANTDPDHDHHAAAPPRYHVTTLTCHMADALAMHLSTHLTDLLLLPLEAMFVRSVALGFLSVAAKKSLSSPIISLQNQVIPPFHWFGPGIRPGGALQYLKNLAFCGSLELALGFGIWQLSAGAAWLIDRKWFSWSRWERDDRASVST